jgi:hypothetical protein
VIRLLAAWGLLAASTVAALSQDSTPSRTPRVVNVTSDSEKGWIPSEELERQVRKTATEFMADEDGGRAAEAYALLAGINKKDQPFPQFSDRILKFNMQAGVVVERRIATVTWTKNPAQAPLPGVYAALDLVNRYANIDRHCGFLVLYQAPSGGAFQIMREENNYMDNATAAGIAKQTSPAAVEAKWAEVYAHCPGYRPPLPEASGETIGYPNVTAALAGLHSKAGVVFKEQDGWTIAEDRADNAFWSFPPPGNPAYPAAVKRYLVTENGGTSLQMTVHCEAAKPACDDLVRTFEELNARMTASLRERH